MDELRKVTREQVSKEIKKLGSANAQFREVFAQFLATDHYNFLLWYSVPVDLQYGSSPRPSCLHLYVHPSRLASFCESYMLYIEMVYHTPARLMLNEYGPSSFPFFIDVDELYAGEDPDMAVAFFVETLVAHVPRLAPYRFHVWIREVDGAFRLHLHVPTFITTQRRIRKLLAGFEYADLAVYSGPNLRVPFCHKLEAGQFSDDRYEQFSCWRFDLDGEQAIQVDPPENPLLSSMLNYQQPKVESGEMDWYRESLEEVKVRVRCPFGTIADPEIYSADWWREEVLSQELINDIIHTVGYQYQCRMGGTWTEEALDAVKEAVFELFSQHCWKVEAGGGAIYTRQFSSIYEAITFEGGTLSVRMPSGSFASKPIKIRDWNASNYTDLVNKFEVESETGKFDRDGNPVYTRKTSTLEWAKLWAAHHAKVYRGGALHVGAKVPPGYFNTFRGSGIYMWEAASFVASNPGFAIEAIDLFRDFLKTVICCDPTEPETSNYNDYAYQVMLHFIMNEVHSPSIKFEWVIYLYNRVQGVGKGRLGQILTLMVGAHNVFKTVNLDAVLGRWGDSASKSLIIYDEVDSAAYTQQEWRKMWSKLKTRATEGSIETENKGQDFRTRNLQDSHLVFSNCVFPCDPEERRLFILTVNDCRKDDRQYWEQWNEVLIEKEGWKAVSFWLGTLNPNTNFSTRQAPRLGATKTQFILQGECSLVGVLNDWVHHGCDLRMEEDETRKVIRDGQEMQEQVNHVFWAIHRGDDHLAASDGWRTIFSLGQLWMRMKQDNPRITKTEVNTQLSDFFGDTPGFRRHNRIIEKDGATQIGVHAQGRLTQTVYIQIPTRDIVQEKLNSRLSNTTPLPDFSIRDETFYRDWFQSL